MDGAITLSISCDGLPTYSGSFDQPVELGRQDPSRSPPENLYEPFPTERGVRIAIAKTAEEHFSRRQVRVSPLHRGTVRIENLSNAIVIRCAGRPGIPPGHAAEYPLPVELQCGRFGLGITAAGVVAVSPPEEKLATLESATTFLGAEALAGDNDLMTVLADMPTPTIDGLVRWWRNVIGVLQSATNSDEFFRQAAESMVSLIGLDMGAVFLFEGSEWKPVALSSKGKASSRPSTRVLRRVHENKRTFWNHVDSAGDGTESIALIDAFVASPILDRNGNVIGALYGHRDRRHSAGMRAITHLEALLVETLACGVAAGLARLKHEQVAVARKIQLEQFFTADLAGQLEARPELLDGRDVEVSVLFCDIRGFSRIAERIGPTQTMAWVGDVLSALSDEIAVTDGVLVDYVGDELMAMWGAPSAQADHAILAGHTARRLREAAPFLNARWQEVIGAPTDYGIGINTGIARVGNIGSTRKFKYGPLGNVVNLASRVRGATQHFRVNTIVTAATRQSFDDSFLVRRLCVVKLVNIAEPVDLYELDCDGKKGRSEVFARYGEALEAFETGSFTNATRILGELLNDFPGDGPALVLLARAVDAIVKEPSEPPIVWELPGK
jgi:adenylate cyclase